MYGYFQEFLWKPLPTEILTLFHSWKHMTSQPHFVLIGFGLVSIPGWIGKLVLY